MYKRHEEAEVGLDIALTSRRTRLIIAQHARNLWNCFVTLCCDVTVLLAGTVVLVCIQYMDYT